MRHLNETAVQSIAQVMFPFPAGEHLLGRQRVRPLALIPWAMLAENACAVDFGQRKRPRRVLRGFDGGRFSSHLCSGGLHKVRVRCACVCACARCVVSSADRVACACSRPVCGDVRHRACNIQVVGCEWAGQTRALDTAGPTARQVSVAIVRLHCFALVPATAHPRPPSTGSRHASMRMIADCVC